MMKFKIFYTINLLTCKYKKKQIVSQRFITNYTV